MKVYFSKTSKERGASLVEYALLIALIAVVGMGSVKFLGRRVEGAFNRVG